MVDGLTFAQWATVLFTSLFAEFIGAAAAVVAAWLTVRAMTKQQIWVCVEEDEEHHKAA